MKTMILYRPIGPAELELIAAVGFRAFPPRLPEQPIFYPATNELYATRIAREWNVRDSGAGFVTRFVVDADYVAPLLTFRCRQSRRCRFPWRSSNRGSPDHRWSSPPA